MSDNRHQREFLVIGDEIPVRADKDRKHRLYRRIPDQYRDRSRGPSSPNDEADNRPGAECRCPSLRLLFSTAASPTHATAPRSRRQAFASASTIIRGGCAFRRALQGPWRIERGAAAPGAGKYPDD